MSSKQDSGWDAGSWGDTDDFADSIPSSSSKLASQAKPSQSSRSSGMKLSAKKTTGSDWDPIDDAWGSISETASRPSRPSSGDSKRTNKSSPKKEKASVRTEMNLGGWDENDDWGTMDAGGGMFEAKEEQGGAADDWGADEDWGSLEATALSTGSRLQVCIESLYVLCLA